MNKVKYIVILTGIMAFASCDCLQRAEGVVLDKETGQPVAGVSVSRVGFGDMPQPTDPTGKFRVQEISGGLFKCPGLSLNFEKKGYKSVVMNYSCSSTNDTVLLEKEK